VNAGETASFSVALNNASGAVYQWRRNGATLTDSANIIGSQSETLEIVTTPDDQASYDCVVTNQFGSVTTKSAVLAVISSTCLGDVNGDGVVNLADLSAVLSNFGITCSD